jgi:hypothetical protein
LKEELLPGLEGLKHFIMHESLGKDVLESLTEGRNVNTHKKKSKTIYHEGNHPVRLYYIVKGKVKTWSAQR